MGSTSCTCEKPLPYTKPSGQVICLNAACGLPIVDQKPPEVRP